MRIAIFGTGGVGGYFGGRLASTGTDVVFVARGEHLRALQRDGLRIVSPRGDAHLPRVTATDDPAAVGPVDAILLTIKTWQLEAALPALATIAGAGEGAYVVPLCNGVEAGDQLAAHLGRARVLEGTCAIISRLGEPGQIVHLGGPPSLTFGELDGAPSARTNALAAAFAPTDIEAKASSAIRAAQWRKLLFVVALGGVGAVTRAPIGIVRSIPQTRRLLTDAMTEILELARRRGIVLEPDTVERTLGFVDALPPEGTTSLQRDLAAGRPSELESWCGVIVRLGREVDMPTPIFDMLYAALLPAERRARSGDPASS